MTDSQNAQSGVDDEEVTFRLPAGTSLWVARLARFLQKDLRFPEVFLIILFRVRHTFPALGVGPFKLREIRMSPSLL